MTSILTVVTIAGAAGWVLVFRPVIGWRWRGAERLSDVLPAGVGAHVALGTLPCAPLFPGSFWVSWAMLSNTATLHINLWPGMKIRQLCFFQLGSPSEHPYGSSAYGSRYRGQRGPTASKSWMNFHRSEVYGSRA